MTVWRLLAAALVATPAQTVVLEDRRGRVGEGGPV